MNSKIPHWTHIMRNKYTIKQGKNTDIIFFEKSFSLIIGNFIKPLLITFWGKFFVYNKNKFTLLVCLVQKARNNMFIVMNSPSWMNSNTYKHILIRISKSDLLFCIDILYFFNVITIASLVQKYTLKIVEFWEWLSLQT